jgi:hypothetical protein
MDCLAEMEERIRHKIREIEQEMHNTHERENTDRLMPKLDTLNFRYHYHVIPTNWKTQVELNLIYL